MASRDITGAGYLGMVFYSVFSGAPIILLAWLGVKIQQQCPRIFSFSDYVQRVSLCALAFKR